MTDVKIYASHRTIFCFVHTHCNETLAVDKRILSTVKAVKKRTKNKHI